MISTATGPALRVEVLVDAWPEVAFRNFTEEIGVGLRAGRSGWIVPEQASTFASGERSPAAPSRPTTP
jgi:hypothetical protein